MTWQDKYSSVGHIRKGKNRLSERHRAGEILAPGYFFLFVYHSVRFWLWLLFLLNVFTSHSTFRILSFLLHLEITIHSKQRFLKTNYCLKKTNELNSRCLLQVLVACNVQGLLEKLVDSNGLLDKINKGLNAYLEKKRLFFPRSVLFTMQQQIVAVLPLWHFNLLYFTLRFPSACTLRRRGETQMSVGCQASGL